ncbi:hypothetical protein GTA08_BOTSDO01757 [Botryosphaeria dothidea]|uniref:Uncharacterized protein n=1 Tax=Botryosphaeria dothidea TaxID=55169 RepID=A0A8H4JAP1_9PEZI|nr:hypothetical protein GTA08_BOTSDO01757 [Botryosphaeria dothidea]
MSSILTLRSIACSALIIFLIYNFTTLSSYICLPSGLPSSSLHTTAATMASPSHLQISLAQKSKSPPTITIRVKNTHPDTPLTFVTWNTPLDPSALPLGVISVADAASGERLNKDTIKIGRKTPPAPDQFVTIAPGEAREQDLELKGPLVPLDKASGKLKVSCKGAWGDVWAGESVGPSEWQEKSGKGLNGEYESEALEVEL